MLAPPGTDIVSLTHDVIRVEPLLRHVRTDGDGAVATFDGCVRDHSNGRATKFLEYESYEEMALLQMKEIAAALHEKFSITRIAIVHRLGHLEIGETSVFIAVSAPHRGAAFDACRFAIDTLKRTVPIWKKEHFQDGAVWADGEVPRTPQEPSAGKTAS